MFCHVKKDSPVDIVFCADAILMVRNEDKLGLGRTAVATWLLVLAGIVGFSTYFFARLC